MIGQYKKQFKNDQQENSEVHSIPQNFDHEPNQNFTDSIKQNIQDFSSSALNQLRHREEGDVDQIMLTEKSNTIKYDKDRIQVKLLDIIKKLKLRRFAQKWINSTRSRMLKNMSSKQYKYLNDKSQDFTDLKNGKNQNQFRIFSQYKLPKIFFKLIIKTFNQIPIINPASFSKRLWDTLMAIVLLYSFFYIPIIVSFGLDENMIFQSYSIEIILFFNILDAIIHISTGFYEHGILCNNKKQIIKKYFNFQFSVDLLSILPLILYKIISLNLQLESKYYHFITLFIFIRWKSQIKIYKNLQQNYILQPKVRDFLSLLDLFLKVLFIAHICACFWIFTGRTSQFIYQNSWIAKTQLLNEPWYIQYLDSFYFCTVTMSTVGYGDIVPVTPLEIIVCILMMLFASGVFGFSITTINKILESFFKNENKILQKMFTIKNYLQKKSISQILQRDITEYLEYVWREEQHNYQEQQNNMIKLLPKYLKNQLYEECNKLILKESPILQNNFSDSLLKDILPIIQEKTFTPNQLIFQQNEENLGACLYFIQQGSIETYLQLQEKEIQDESISKNTQKPIKVFKKGDYFGEIEFFTGKLAETNVKSTDFTTLLILNRNDFIKILKKFPQDLEQFCYIKDKIIFSNDYSKVFHSCYSCNSQKHTIKQCPYIHFSQDTHKALALQNKIDNNQVISETQQKIARSEYKLKFILLDLQRIHQQFQDENEESIDYYEQNYLQYSISQCEQCSYIRSDSEKKMQFQQTFYKSLDHFHEIHNNQNDQNNQIQFQQKRQSNLINQGDQYNLQSLKSIYKKQIAEPENISRLQNSVQKQKIVKRHENEISNQQLSSQLQPSSFQSVSLQSIMNYPQSNITDIELQADLQQDHLNNMLSSNNQYYAEQQNFTNMLRISIEGIKQNIYQELEKQHCLQKYFDIFSGNFEKLKCFSFYFPLSNYDLVIKQIYLSSEQKKIMQKKMLEKQIQKFSKMLNRRRKTTNLNSNNSEVKTRRDSIKIQETSKNHKSHLIQYNNSTIQNMCSIQQSMHTNPIINKQLISLSQFESKSPNQSYDKFEDNDTLKMQNQKIKQESLNFFSNNFENKQEQNQQIKLLHNKQLNLSKMYNSNIELSKFNDTNAQEILNETLLLNIQANKNSLNQRREEEFISSSPMIENKILKLNSSYIPTICVSKYNNQQENSYN
ncbi:cyclic nucleotide-binding domain protein (macronuclear) [Tetrahymena thermophila SB210]|uniref:Cyclic nucleotide-binding domain protein n=1 Tax=Tetrahymena thermophila (strain SB210) TaxID=312017 RepID=I7MDT3_TETTS|nr:cyclic nucleotide-binding domain protein [Tetrahymena thermophila SB210]EAR90909.3 cyclic nucleotide-binding domain protein [Tetrahymena thermophila SB210]|eukprot:XP_001011154.3 cyclic nucleotide-binding domain protein [Tetrahymena thermophila SB210]